MHVLSIPAADAAKDDRCADDVPSDIDSDNEYDEYVDTTLKNWGNSITRILVMKHAPSCVVFEAKCTHDT